MKKIITLALVIIIIYALARVAYLSAAYRSEQTPTPGSARALAADATNTARPKPTNTPIPTATVGYQETAIHAQATADEARRINAQATAGFEERMLEQVRITAAYEERVQNILSWTATAAITTIPLTATQQAINNTQVPQEQALVFGRMTGTAQAPTQMALIVNTENRRKYGWMGYVFQLGAGILFITIAVILWMLIGHPGDPGQADEVEQESETVITVRTDNGGGYTSDRRYVIPCTRAQLDELALLAVNGERSFAINRLESKSLILNRATLYAFREWLKSNRFAFIQNQESGEIALNDRGLEFLAGWMKTKELPDNYQVGIMDNK